VNFEYETKRNFVSVSRDNMLTCDKNQSIYGQKVKQLSHRRLEQGTVLSAGSPTYQIFLKYFLGYRSRARSPNPNLEP